MPLLLQLDPDGEGGPGAPKRDLGIGGYSSHPGGSLRCKPLKKRHITFPLSRRSSKSKGGYPSHPGGRTSPNPNQIMYLIFSTRHTSDFYNSPHFRFRLPFAAKKKSIATKVETGFAVSHRKQTTAPLPDRNKIGPGASRSNHQEKPNAPRETCSCLHFPEFKIYGAARNATCVDTYQGRA
jgi:hypothetical protein